jgi:glucans biosynthesis protein C
LINHISKMQKPSTLKKNKYVESLRGLAIILVVFGHIIGSDKTGGMKVEDNSIFRYLYFSLEYIRLPLFTVISGWVYANRPIFFYSRNVFLRNKIKRLIIPLITVSTLLFLLRIITPGTNTSPELSDIWKNIFFPYDIYWYIYSLFIIFLGIIVIDSQSFFHSLKGWAITFIASLSLLFISSAYLDAVPNFFSFKGAIYLFPFFLFGISLFRYKKIIFKKGYEIGLAILFLIGIGIQQLSWFGVLPLQARISMLAFVVGVSGVYFLFRLRFKSNMLIWIGQYAYEIFLFHVFFTGGTRIALLRIGIENKWAILVLALMISILIPILLQKLFSQSGLLSLLFLGRSLKNKKRSSIPLSSAPNLRNPSSEDLLESSMASR